MEVVLDNTDSVKTVGFNHVTLKQAIEGLGQLAKKNPTSQSNIECISSYKNIAKLAESKDQIIPVWQVNYHNDLFLKIGGWGLLKDPQPV